MERRKKIKYTSFTLVLLTVFAILAVTATVRADRLEREKRAEIQQAVSELDEYVSSIDATLSKGIYATTPPMVLSVSTELWRLSTGAKIMLSQIPNDSIDTSKTNKYFSQLGELMMSLNRKAANGGQLSEKDIATLSQLLKYAKALHASTTALREGVFDGSVELIKKSGNIADSSAADATPLSTGLEKAEQIVTDMPSLIYDGPFSDHLERSEARFLSGRKEISENEARKKAAEYLGADEESLRFSAMDNGTLTSYVFVSDRTTVAVTKKGGFLSYIISPEYAGEGSFSYEQARDKAAEYLKKAGFDSMADTYHSESDGVCTLNFACDENGVRCYPDLIKISVSLADGRVLSVDARNYLLSHRTRNLSSESFASFDRAEKSISPLLHIKNTRAAVIPTDSGNERICYEFHCSDSDGQEVLVYIDADTFNEADILLLLYSDNGVLTK